MDKYQTFLGIGRLHNTCINKDNAEKKNEPLSKGLPVANIPPPITTATCGLLQLYVRCLLDLYVNSLPQD